MSQVDLRGPQELCELFSNIDRVASHIIFVADDAYNVCGERKKSLVADNNLQNYRFNICVYINESVMILL